MTVISYKENELLRKREVKRKAGRRKERNWKDARQGRQCSRKRRSASGQRGQQGSCRQAPQEKGEPAHREMGPRG